jgi:3-oxoacyl-[acyl-carrier protein] reductase
MDTDLQGRIALITGGGRNIGRGIATKFAEAGARVVVTWESDETSALGACKLIQDAGGSAEARHLDLCDTASMKGFARELTSRVGAVDILVHNSALRQAYSWEEISEGLWEKIFGINVRGPVFLTQLLAPAMLEQGWGRIVSLGGVHAYVGSGNAAVTGSKLALVGATRAMAYEFANSGVTANVVVPGFIDTVRRLDGSHAAHQPMAERLANVPVGRLGTVDDIANLCLFLASDAGGYITGQEIFATGGLFPMSPKR